MDERACPICGAEVPLRKTQPSRPRIYCSTRCGKKAARDNSAKVCSADHCGKPVRAKGFCAYHYKREFYPDAHARWPENPENRRRKLRTKTQLRRAQLRDPDAETIDRDAIGERDGWRCGLCAKKVERTVAWPDPEGPSLDHIVPLSRGGKHVRANVQIAHLRCNMAKGNRGGGEQLLLIG